MTENKSWQELNGETFLKAVNAINSVLKNDVFPVKSSVLETKNLSFYKNLKLLKATALKAYPRLVMNFLYNDNKIIKLDFSASSISKANSEAPIELNQDNLKDYLKFFFNSIRGDNNEPFFFVESLTDIPFTSDTDDELKEDIKQKLKPIKIEQTDNGEFSVNAYITHKNNLYSTKIFVAGDGNVNIQEEQAMFSELPIRKNLLK